MELHPKAVEKYDQDAEALLLQLSPAPPIPSRPDAFTPDLPYVAHFKPEEVLNFQESLTDVSGNEIAWCFLHDGKRMGFEGEVYKNMARLCERVQEAKEVRDVVSLVTIRKAFRDWVVGRYANTTSDFMTRYVLGRCGSEVAETEILIPIAATMIDGEIQLGRVTLKTFSRDTFESWKATFQSEGRDAESLKDVTSIVEHEQQELQGRAVSSMTLVAEPRRAYEIALDETETALALLRFYTAANLIPGKASYLRPLGLENIEKHRYLAVKGGVLTATASDIKDNAGVFLTVNNDMIRMMKESGLDTLNALLLEPKKTEFQQVLLDTLLLYSRHTLAKNLSDKLIAMFGALDSFMLNDDNEPIQQNMSERIAFTVSNDSKERAAIVATVKKAYGMRSRFIHHAQKVEDTELIQGLLLIVWRFFLILIVEHNRFPTRRELFAELERRKFA